MTKREVKGKIQEIICNKFRIDKKEIIPEATFKSLGVDSLDMVEIIDDIEKIFKINISDNKTTKFYNITTVVVFIDSVADYFIYMSGKVK